MSTYDPKHGDERRCHCGHTYYRHFDSYEDMEAVGCKYCSCQEWREPEHAVGQALARMESLPQSEDDLKITASLKALVDLIGSSNRYSGILTEGTLKLSGRNGEPDGHVILARYQWDRIVKVLQALGIQVSEYTPNETETT